jgi:hypothetical protein
MPSNGMAILRGYGLLLSDRRSGQNWKVDYVRNVHHSGPTVYMRKMERQIASRNARNSGIGVSCRRTRAKFFGR